MIAQFILAYVFFVAFGIDAGLIEGVVFLLDGGHEDVHQLFGRSVIRHAAHAVLAVFDACHLVFADKGPGMVAVGCGVSHDVPRHVQRHRRDHPAEVEGADFFLAWIRVLAGDVADSRQYRPAFYFIQTGIDLAAEALHGLIGPQPVPAIDIDEVVAR